VRGQQRREQRHEEKDAQDQDSEERLAVGEDNGPDAPQGARARGRLRLRENGSDRALVVNRDVLVHGFSPF
jgi:hypothetical protein